MKSEKVNIRKSHQRRFLNWKLVVSSLFLTPTCILLACFEGKANWPTKAVISNDPNGNDPSTQTVQIVQEFSSNGRQSVRARRAARNNVVAAYHDKISIYNDDKSHAAVVYYIRNRAMGFVGKFGPNLSDGKASSYLFACAFEGTGQTTLNWGVTRFGSDGRTCARGFRVRSSDGSTSSIEHPFNDPYALLTKSFDLTSNVSSNGTVRYCSAVSSDGDSWDFSISQRNWIDIFSPNISPCEEAIQLCENKTDNECSIANQGEWGLERPNLTASLYCKNDRSFASSNLNGMDVETSLRELKNKATVESQNACVPVVISQNEVIAEPYGSEATQIQTITTDTKIIIDTLAGAVFVRSAADPVGKLLLKGESYIYDLLGQTSEIVFFDAPTRQVIPLSNNPPPLDCENFQIPGDPEADNFAEICAQGNEAQLAPLWQKYPVSTQSQLGLSLKQSFTPGIEYASIHLPPDWAQVSGSYDFVASNNSAAPETSASLNNSRRVSISRIALGEFQNDLILDGLDNQLRQNGTARVQANLTLDDLTDQLQENGAETVRRVNLADGEGIEATASSENVDDISTPAKTLAYYLIQGDYLYIILLEVYGEEYQQAESYQEMRKIAQSFRLTPVLQGPSSVPQGPL